MIMWRSRNRRMDQGERRPANTRMHRRGGRGGPRHVLEASVESRREARLRRAARLRCLFAAVAVGFTILAAGAGGRAVVQRCLYENAELRLTRLDVITDGVLTRQRILHHAGVSEGGNLLSVNLRSVRENLMQIPQVKSVAVTRRLPGFLEIRLAERFACAWLSCKSLGILPHSTRDGYLLDEKGVPFACRALVEEYLGLPVIHVDELPDLVPGSPLTSRQVQASLRLLLLSRQSLFDKGLEILAIHAPNSYSLVAKYNNGAIVTFGLSNLNEQLSNLRSAIQHAAETDRAIASINLLLNRNIPVVYADAPPPEETGGFAPREFVPGETAAPTSLPEAPEAAAVATGGGRKQDQVRAILGR